MYQVSPDVETLSIDDRRKAVIVKARMSMPHLVADQIEIVALTTLSPVTTISFLEKYVKDWIGYT